MGDTTLRGVNTCTTKALLVNVFTSYALHHFWTSQEHIGSAFNHQGEVGKCRRINGTTGTRTGNHRNLRNHTRSKDVALEDLCISSQCVDTFLDTSTTRVVDTDNGRTHLHAEVHHLADLLTHSLRE